MRRILQSAEMGTERKILPLYDKEYFKIMSEEYSHMSYKYVFNQVYSAMEKHARKHDKVLDVGCGVGWLLQRALELGCNVHGIDFAIAGIKITKAKLKEANLLSSDACHIPFKEESFDLVTCTWLLEHVEEPDEILAEVFRLLKYGGIAIIMSPSGELIHSKKKSPIFTSLEEFGEEHFWEFSPIGLQGLIEKSGLKIKERRGIYRFHFQNLFTFPILKLISSAVSNSDPKAEFSALSKHTSNKSREAGFPRIVQIFISRSFISALMHYGFNVFMKIETFLGDKTPFNFFGIETLFVCQKSR